VLTPLYVGLQNAKPLPYASSLCSACKQACPINIDIPRMLLDLRAEMVENGLTEKLYDAGIKAWEIGNKSPRLFELGGRAARIGQKITGGKIMPGPLGNWTEYRDFPDFAPKSFRQLWRERKQS
jgi:L-lactate dehydrogenase complex protein LldF